MAEFILSFVREPQFLDCMFSRFIELRFRIIHQNK